MAPKPVVIAVVTDDERSEQAIRVATEHARRDGARVILYDVDAAPSMLESPLPTKWSAGDDDQQVPPALTPDELRAAGQAGLASKVQALADAGIEALGWLPSGHGADELARYAARMGATEIIATPGIDPDPEAVREHGPTAVTVAG